MRWPWTKRAEVAEREAHAARESRDRAVSQRPVVNAVVGETRRHGQMNGFSSLIVTSIRK